MFTKQLKYVDVKGDHILAALLSEMFASYLFIIAFLIQNEKKTLISQDKGIRALVIAGCYAFLVSFTRVNGGGSINPAYGFGLGFVDLIGGDKGDGLSYFWIYCLFPFIGSILALITYDFMWKKVLNA